MSPRAVLIGPPAAGKSKLGKRVASRLGLTFVDTDKRVVAEHGPIPAIFEKYGEPQFREWERAAVIDALDTDGIVSLGGGAILNEETQRDLADVTVVLVMASAAAIATRLTAGTRPLLAGGMDAWRALMTSRAPIYERLATMTVDTSVGTMDAHADALAVRLRAQL